MVQPFFAEQGSFAVALLVLNALWLFTTGRAFLAIRQRRVATHRRWMIRSYIVTFAFVTFGSLALLPIWEPFGAHREAAAGWASWIIPLLVAEFLFRRQRPSPLPESIV